MSDQNANPNEITINGKKVTLREKLPARLFYALLDSDLSNLTIEKAVRLSTPAVASWEFEGDPQSEAAWGELDMFSELVPLLRIVQARLLAGMGESKN